MFFIQGYECEAGTLGRVNRQQGVVNEQRFYVNGAVMRSSLTLLIAVDKTLCNFG